MDGKRASSLLTIDQLCEQFQVPKSWVYARTREKGPGAIPVIRVGKYLRFRLEDVLQWIEANQ